MKVNLERQMGKIFASSYLIYTDQLHTDGMMIKKDTMSIYLKRCFKKSIKLTNCPNGRLDYHYYLDEVNRVCILFTDPWIEDPKDEYEVAIKTDSIVVALYCSESDFTNEYLWTYYHKCIVLPGKDDWWFENGYYYTDSKEYNDLPLVKAISQISDRPDLLRIRTVADIINS